jgi:hypothetical protein
MPPVIAAVQAAFAWIGTQLAAIAAWKIGEFAIGSFLLNTVIGIGLNALLAPRQKSRVAERQADALQLSLGEGPREFVFGKMGLGGALLNAWNYGGKHGTDWNVFAIKLADHEIDALESFYVNDELQTFSGDGAVSAYTVDGSEHLRVYFQRGTQSAPPTAITSNSGGKWTSAHVAKGCAIVYVEYKANEKVWPQGRPRFVWNVRGARLYDPRKDSTVAGGSGAHRWSDKTTWEFSTNLYLAFCNWSWGITDAGASGGKLILGRGLTFDQFPAAARFAKLNICDEDVTLKAGGTQKRYHGGGLIQSTQTFADAVDDFAACMGGEIVNRDGVVDVEPGASKTVSVAIDEGDLLAFEPVRVVPHLDFDSRCNTAVARFTDPDQLWQDASAPMRRSAADIVSDKGYFEKTFDLVFVQNYITAQRIAEIRRRQARLERSFTIALGPRFIGLEIGDWITLTSARYLGGSTVTFVITGLQQEIAYEQGRIRFRIALALREIASSVYSWTAATDEIDKDQALDLTPFRPTTASFAGFTLTAIQIAGAGGTTSPTIRVNWTGVTDPAYRAALIEYRVQGTTNVQQERSPFPASGVHVLAGIIEPLTTYEVRIKPETEPQREETWTSWTAVTTGAGVANAASLELSAASVRIACDHTGAAFTGQLPRAVKATFRVGGVDRSADVAWSLDATVNCTATIDDTATASGGTVSITAVTSDGSVRIEGDLGGLILRATVSVFRDLAPPPNTGGGGTTVNDSTLDAVTSGTAVAVSDVLTVKTGALGQIQLVAPVTYTRQGSSVGTVTCGIQWQRNISGTWTNVASEAAGTAADNIDEGGFIAKYEGGATANETVTGLTANTDYEVRLMARRTAGSGNADLFGTITAIGT